MRVLRNFFLKFHSYTDLYYFLFSNQRLQIKSFFELGIGTNKVFNNEFKRKSLPELPSGYGRIFSSKEILGADIDPNTIFAEDRIKTFKVDQSIQKA